MRIEKIKRKFEKIALRTEPFFPNFFIVSYSNDKMFIYLKWERVKMHTQA
jgi:hypothetical protein